MKEWLLFTLYLIVGLGMLVAGIIYMRKEKNDPESVKIYGAASIIGAVLTIGAVAFKFLFLIVDFCTIAVYIAQNRAADMTGFVFTLCIYSLF